MKSEVAICERLKSNISLITYGNTENESVFFNVYF